MFDPRSFFVGLIALLYAVFSTGSQAQTNRDLIPVNTGSLRIVVVQVDTQGEPTILGHGTGFAVNSTHVVTNSHVIRLKAEYPDRVALIAIPASGGNGFIADIIGDDRLNDLAVLRLREAGVAPITLSDRVMARGEQVFAVGYPGSVDNLSVAVNQHGFDPSRATQTTGEINNLIGSPTQPHSYVHTAAIARGNSGGALVDRCGRVVGVNTSQSSSERGDSSFKRASSSIILADFLRNNNVIFHVVTTGCQPIESYLDRVQASERERNLERQVAEQARIEERTQSEANALARQQANYQEAWNEQLLRAILLVMSALFAAGFALILHQKNKLVAFRLVAAISSTLMFGFVYSFMDMPILSDFGEAYFESDETEIGLTLEPGRLVCSVEEGESRITTSGSEALDFVWGANNCIGNGTQYTADGDRIETLLVSDNSNLATRFEFEPSTATLIQTRYFLSPAEAIALRAYVPEDRSCTEDTSRLNALRVSQEELERALPQYPNERIVYSCDSR